MSRSNPCECAPGISVSPEKLRANRANARKSTGPTSADGKERASRNALAHGIFSRESVLPGENREMFDALRQELIKEHRPQTLTELFLVDQMVRCMWRMNRLRAAEASSHESHTEQMKRSLSNREAEQLTAERNMADILAGTPGESSVLEKLHRYEKRLEGTFHRSLKELRKLRTPIKGEEIPEEPSPFLDALKPEVPVEQRVNNDDENLQNEATDSGEPEETTPVTRASCPCVTLDDTQNSVFPVAGIASTGKDARVTSRDGGREW